MSPSLDTTSELQTISQLLHLTFHRNKNQHRLTKWWSSLSQLRRSLSKLLSDIHSDPPRSLVLASKKKKKKAGDEMSRVEERVEFMLEILIPKCYLVFSRVVADNQWAALGLMLLANLARLQRLIEPLRKVVVVEDERKEDRVARKVEEDLGQSVSRDEIKLGSVNEIGDEENEDQLKISEKEKKDKKRKVLLQGSEGDVSEPSSSKPPKKKRKKKGGDAFDDLFDSLI